MKLSAGELAANDLGKTITCAAGGTSITGLLTGIDSSADLISEGYFGEAVPRWAIGRRHMTLTIAPQLTINVAPSTPVEIA